MISTSVEDAARLMKAGQLVAFPTETVYGLGAVALDPKAVARIFEVKRRPRFDPLIVHVATPGGAFSLAATRPRLAQVLAEAFWPGPLTLVLPKSPLVPDIVTSGLGSVALRVPDHPVALALLETVGTPVAAPSANRFGRISPTRATHVQTDLGDDVSLILDGGPCRKGVESTVLSLLEEQPTLLRPGATTREQIEAVIGPIGFAQNTSAPHHSPGQLTSHYAPHTPMRKLTPETRPRVDERVGLLAIAPRDATGYAAVEVLSQSGDLLEAAAGLFAALRRLDAQRLDRIDCEMAPLRGIGVAINDRLARGCQR